MTGFKYTPATKILAFPASISPTTQTLTLATNTTRFESPFGRYVQTQEYPGAPWKLTAEFTLDAQQAAVLRAFKSKLRGTPGMFYFKADESVVDIFPQVLTEQGVQTYSSRYGNPRTVGGHPAGQPLQTKGWTADAGSLVLSKGEYVCFDDYYGYRHLHIVTQDAYVDLDGLATLHVEPPLIAQPPVDSDLMVECPSGLFRLLSDDGLEISQSSAVEFKATLTAVQALNPNVNFTLEPYPPEDQQPAPGAVLQFSSPTFATVAPSHATPCQITLTNIGDEPAYQLRVSHVLPQGPLLSTTCGDVLEAGESCVINFEIVAPAVEGAFTRKAKAYAHNADKAIGTMSGQAKYSGGIQAETQGVLAFDDTAACALVEYPSGPRTNPRVRLGIYSAAHNFAPRIARIRNFGAAYAYLTFNAEDSWVDTDGGAQMETLLYNGSDGIRVVGRVIRTSEGVNELTNGYTQFEMAPNAYVDVYMFGFVAAPPDPLAPPGLGSAIVTSIFQSTSADALTPIGDDLHITVVGEAYQLAYSVELPPPVSCQVGQYALTTPVIVRNTSDYPFEITSVGWMDITGANTTIGQEFELSDGGTSFYPFVKLDNSRVFVEPGGWSQVGVRFTPTPVAPFGPRSAANFLKINTTETVNFQVSSNAGGGWPALCPPGSTPGLEYVIPVAILHPGVPVVTPLELHNVGIDTLTITKIEAINDNAVLRAKLTGFTLPLSIAAGEFAAVSLVTRGAVEGIGGHVHFKLTFQEGLCTYTFDTSAHFGTGGSSGES